MTRSQASSQCPLCGGTKAPGATTFTADFEFGVVVVRRVPALVCSLCGAGLRRCLWKSGCSLKPVVMIVVSYLLTLPQT